MKRVLYVVSREQPLLVGYLMTSAGARFPRGRVVEIKVDERRGERRVSSEVRDLERRSRERRLLPSLDRELHARGYATVVRSEAGPSLAPGATPERALAWRPRASWGQRAARAGRRSRAGWGVIVVLLAAAGVSIGLTWSIRGTLVPSPPAPAPPASRIEEAPPPPPAAKAETVVPAVSLPPPSRPAPVRVSTRFSGVVLSVDPNARALVLEDRGAATAERLRVELAPDARVVLSERDANAEDPSHPFKDTVISLSDVGRGDYVVVEMRGPEGKELARSVSVTFRPR